MLCLITSQTELQRPFLPTFFSKISHDFFFLDSKYIVKSGLGEKMAFLSDWMPAQMGASDYEAFSKMLKIIGS